MSPSDIADEILGTAAEDQRVRKNRPDPAVDQHNTARMKEIIDSLGWPTRTKVGERAEHMAWLLVQHADFDLMWQRRCLALMALEASE